ncbi:MAG: hypothetical protein ACRD9R_07830 [Pyrinomonadaceae bacterium]
MSAANPEQETHSPDGAAADESGDSQANGSGVMLAAEGGNIDKIRDILFGVQMRDYEKRFSRLEERLLKESADLRDDTRKRFEALEAFVRREFESVAERLRSEQNRREESDQNLSRNLHEAGQHFERKFVQFEEQTARAHSDLRQQLLDQSKDLNDEIRRKSEELTALLERQAGELRHDKTDRSALAGLFTEVAMRLNNEFRIPGDN